MLPAWPQASRAMSETSDTPEEYQAGAFNGEDLETGSIFSKDDSEDDEEDTEKWRKKFKRRVKVPALPVWGWISSVK